MKDQLNFDEIPTPKDYTVGPCGTALTSAINELERELKTRERVFPRWVAQGKLKPHDAQWRIDCLSDLIFFLKKIK